MHCQPVGDGAAALKYLAPYIFRVALSNNRIVSLENDWVTFRYRDAKTDQTRTCTLLAEAFIQRFLQHVLPKGFMKVRYYGFFSAGNRRRLNQVRHLLRAAPLRPTNDHQAEAILAERTLSCPKCGEAMQMVQKLRARSRHPP